MDHRVRREVEYAPAEALAEEVEDGGGALHHVVVKGDYQQAAPDQASVETLALARHCAIQFPDQRHVEDALRRSLKYRNVSYGYQRAP